MGRAIVAQLSLAALLSSVAPARAEQQADRDAEAFQLFSAGELAFKDAHYEDALADFKRAYDLSARPELLYNIGIVADRLRHDREALGALERFLKDAPPTVEHRTDAEARVRVLREAVARADLAATESAAPSRGTPDRTDSATKGPGALPWLVIGTGAAVATAGVVLLVLGESDRSKVESAPQGSAWSSYSGAASRAPIFDAIGITAIVLGAAGAGFGVVLATKSGRGREIAVALLPGAVSARGAF